MTLLYILAATLLGGLASVLVAARVTPHRLGHWLPHGVSFSTGVLLGTALLNLLPEAFTGVSEAHQVSALFATLLGGLLFFFLLEKAELYRHSHHHEGDHHHHHSGFDHAQAGRGGWSVLLGDSVHNFCDGVLIAAAFLTDTHLGVVTALAIVTHEIPQEVGDYLVLINAGFSRHRALFYNALSGLAAVLGGIVGWALAEPAAAWFGHLLVLAASSFLYVAVADLIPQLQHRLNWRGTVTQVAILLVGLACVALLNTWIHEH